MDALKLELLSYESLYSLQNLGCSLKLLPYSDLSSAHRLETQGFPPDEACPFDAMELRHKEAGDFFVGCYMECTPKDLKKEEEEGLKGENECSILGGQDSSSRGTVLLPQNLVGFICSTRSVSDDIQHESLRSHDPNGATLCIHSVVVAEKVQRRGVASTMLAAYIEHIVGFSGLKRVRLMVKQHLLNFYTQVGFQFIRPSPITHGCDPWFELGIEFDQTSVPRGLPWHHVDAFTSEVFSGNPARVFFTHANNNVSWMQSCASEMNMDISVFVERIIAGEDPVESTLSSSKYCSRPAELGMCHGKTVPRLTTSLRKQEHMDTHYRNENGHESKEGGEVQLQPLQEHRFRIRWFAPLTEVYLCGHGTLAAAHSLWERNIAVPNSSRIVFETQENEELICQMGEDGWISMLFPVRPTDDVRLKSSETTAVQEGLGLLSSDIIATHRNSTFLLVVISLEAFLERLYPHIDLFLRASCCPQHVIVTCAATDSDEIDFYSRMFCPNVGVYEDPVRGSDHCILAPYWAEVLGKVSLVGKQKTPRGGLVRCRYIKDTNQVELAGLAVTVATGTFPRPMDFYYTTK